MSRIAVFVLMIVFQGTSFTLYTDTVYSWQYTGNSDLYDTIYQNSGSDTVTIDSIRIVEIESHAEMYELSFFLIARDNNSESIFEGFQFWKDQNYYDSKYYPAIQVPPGVFVTITYVCLDMCCACPLAKRSSRNGYDDPLIMKILFYSNTEIDSCVALSKQKITSTHINMNEFSNGAYGKVVHEKSHNILGQQIRETGTFNGIHIQFRNGKYMARIGAK